MLAAGAQVDLEPGCDQGLLSCEGSQSLERPWPAWSSATVDQLCDALSAEAGEAAEQAVGGAGLVGAGERASQLFACGFELVLGFADGFDRLGDRGHLLRELGHRFASPRHLAPLGSPAPLPPVNTIGKTASFY